MRNYVVSRTKGAIIVPCGPGNKAVQFNPGNRLPREVVEYLEKEGVLKSCIAKGLVLAEGEPELPKKVKQLGPDVSGETSITDIEVHTPPVKDEDIRPPQADVTRPPGTTFDTPVALAGKLVQEQVDAPKTVKKAHPIGSNTTPWTLNPILLDQCSLEQLTAIIKDKDKQAPEPENAKEAVRFLSQDWRPENDAQKQAAIAKGYYEKE